MSIRSGQNLTTGFFLNRQKRFLSLVFHQPRCQGNNTHFAKMREQTLLWLTLTLAKMGAKALSGESKGELGTGSSKLCSATLSDN